MKVKSPRTFFLLLVILIPVACSFPGYSHQVEPALTAAFTRAATVKSSATFEPSITATPAQTDTVLPLATCEGTYIAIQIVLPNNGWTCRVDSLNSSGIISDELIYLQSPLFTVVIGTLGRGSYCGDGPDSTGCVVTEFYENQFSRLFTYNADGKNMEIFGVTNRNIRTDGSEGYVWMSIKYQGMEERELTSTEKQELIQMLDSIIYPK